MEPLLFWSFFFFFSFKRLNVLFLFLFFYVSVLKFVNDFSKEAIYGIPSTFGSIRFSKLILLIVGRLDFIYKASRIFNFLILLPVWSIFVSLTEIFLHHAVRKLYFCKW